MNSDSTNTTVLLIGASRGLGYAIAAEYLERGSQVVATVRGPERAALHDLQETAVGGWRSGTSTSTRRSRSKLFATGSVPANSISSSSTRASPTARRRPPRTSQPRSSPA
jgi:NAD(P)-dependent dehydrogenase (short-subunit alcohol dehydrogenase family)